MLTFTKDPSVTGTVAGPKTVLFRGAEHSLSGAALQVIREMGYNWTRVNGYDYWTIDGIKLSARTLPAPSRRHRGGSAMTNAA